jgi:hypothetical protein
LIGPHGPRARSLVEARYLDGHEALFPDAVAIRAAVLVADLVEPARVTALERLDTCRQTLTIATGWLRAKLESSRGDTDEREQ